MQVIYHNRPRLRAADEAGTRYVNFETLLRESDHLALVVAYSQAVYDIIGAAQLLQMKAGAMLVNIARGRVMDDAALASALRSLSIRP
jgi:gluconate 2-dehydrogenase